jgi:hypothetical protein
LLDFATLANETSESIHNLIIEILEKHNLNFQNMVSLCADNAPVNFGGPQLKGVNNVFHRLKNQNQRLLPIGCPAHILHNAAKSATDQLPIDIESIAFKIQSHFKGSTTRHEALTELFDRMGVCLKILSLNLLFYRKCMQSCQAILQFVGLRWAHLLEN